MSAGDIGETLLLRPSRWKLLVMLATALGFVAIGVWIMPADDWSRWLVIGFFGLCAAVFIVQLAPGANYLKLDREGFTYATLFRPIRVAWHDVSPFSAGHIWLTRVVQFDPAQSATDPNAKRAVAALARGLTGASGALPNTYGMTADALAELMNRWRDRAIARTG